MSHIEANALLLFLTWVVEYVSWTIFSPLLLKRSSICVGEKYVLVVIVQIVSTFSCIGSLYLLLASSFYRNSSTTLRGCPTSGVGATWLQGLIFCDSTSMSDLAPLWYLLLFLPQYVQLSKIHEVLHKGHHIFHELLNLSFKCLRGINNTNSFLT